MKEYKYVDLKNLEEYDGWEIVQIIPRYNKDYNNMAVIMKEDKPIQNYIKLNEATDEQLIEELLKRLNKGGKDE